MTGSSETVARELVKHRTSDRLDGIIVSQTLLVMAFKQCESVTI